MLASHGDIQENILKALVYERSNTIHVVPHLVPSMLRKLSQIDKKILKVLLSP
jgi:hypothetical protein